MNISKLLLKQFSCVKKLLLNVNAFYSMSKIERYNHSCNSSAAQVKRHLTNVEYKVKCHCVVFYTLSLIHSLLNRFNANELNPWHFAFKIDLVIDLLRQLWNHRKNKSLETNVGYCILSIWQHKQFLRTAWTKRQIYYSCKWLFSCFFFKFTHLTVFCILVYLCILSTNFAFI